jgi:hypothetical protein
MSDQEQPEQAERRISVAIWTTARGGPQWKVRVTEQADPDEIDLVLGRALAAHRRLEAELAAGAPAFVGEEPKGDAA